MYVVIVEFVSHAIHTSAFIERVRQQARASLRDEAGCHVFDMCLDPEQPNFVLLYEVYTDRAAFEAHLDTAHFRAFDADVRDWIEDKRVRTYERVEPV